MKGNDAKQAMLLNTFSQASSKTSKPKKKNTNKV